MCLNGKRQPRTEVKHKEMGSVCGGVILKVGNIEGFVTKRKNLETYK